MTITKLGHCCLLIEVKGKRILTDPGMFSIEAHLKADRLDYILFTHEHGDHFHLDSLKQVLQNNPTAKIYANVSVGDLLENEEIPYTLLEDGESAELGEDLSIKGIGKKHAVIHSSIPQSDNLGYFIDGRLFYPGDALTVPENEKVEILALPVGGPWLKFGEALDYAIHVKPKTAFPVHDAVMIEALRKGMVPQMAGKILSENGIEFVPLDNGETKEFY
jgi:L-ascorbate metabolism protein UlaG (beta-lactamase superfamily)